jgi:hypothetical protein
MARLEACLTLSSCLLFPWPRLFALTVPEFQEVAHGGKAWATATL